MRLSLLLMSLLLIPAAALADSKPVEIAAIIRAEKPLGEGSMSKLMITAYDASLWTDAPQWSGSKPYALKLSYHMGFSTAEIVDRSVAEMKTNDPSMTAETAAHYHDEMSRLFPDVKSGDEITGLSLPDGTVKFFHNGQQTGELHDAKFQRAFFGIWLSPATTEPKLRARLLNIAQ